MIDNTRDRLVEIVARFKELEIDTSDPKWSSWRLDRVFAEVVSHPGGALQDLYQGLDAALRTYRVELTETVANFIKDVTVKAFTQPYRAAYDVMSWDWVNAALERGATAAQCYLFLRLLPADAATPQSLLAILRGLEGTCRQREAANTLSEDLQRSEVRQPLASNETSLGLANTFSPSESIPKGHLP